MRVRRVVTRHDADGRAVVASDSDVEGFRPALAPGSEFHLLWGADEPPTFPDDGSVPSQEMYFPPVGGFRFSVVAVPPEDHGDVQPPGDIEAAIAEVEARLPGMIAHMEPGTGMHTSATIDFVVVLEGEVWLELDDGAEVHLRTGDTVVQNGTRHAWRNHGTTTARIAGVEVGAHHQRLGRLEH